MGTQSSVFDDIEENELDDIDETADVDELAEPESRLAIGNARSGGCTRLGDCGEDCGGANNFSNGGSVVGSGGLEGSEGKSEDCARLGD